MSTYPLDIVVNVLGVDAARSSLASIVHSIDEFIARQEKVAIEVRKGTVYLGHHTTSMADLAKTIDEVLPRYKDVSAEQLKLRINLVDGTEKTKVFSGSLLELRDSAEKLGHQLTLAQKYTGGFTDSLSAASGVLSRLNAIAVQGSILLFVFGITAGRVRTSTLSVARAQDTYNEAVAKFGPNSVQAQKALRALQKAQTDQTFAIMQARIQAILFGLSIGQAAMNAIKMVSSIVHLIKAYTALKATTMALNAALAVKNALLTMGIGLGISMAAAAGFMLWVEQQINSALEDYTPLAEDAADATTRMKKAMDELAWTGEGMYQTWSEIVAGIAGDTRAMLVGQAQNAIREFTECSTSKNERMVRYLVEQYNRLREEAVENYYKMLEEAERVGGEQGQMLRENAEEYRRDSQKKLDTLYKLWEVYFKAWREGSEVTMADIAHILAEPLPTPELKAALIQQAFPAIYKEYGDLETYLREHPLESTLNIDRTQFDKLREDWEEWRKQLEVPAEEAPTPPQRRLPFGYPSGMPFPGRQFGGIIPVTGLYRLHAGERVVTEAYRPAPLIVTIENMVFQQAPLTEAEAQRIALDIFTRIRDIEVREGRRRWIW